MRRTLNPFPLDALEPSAKFEDGSPDFSLPSQIVWRADLEALLWGRVTSVPAYLGNPLPLREKPNVNPISKESGGDVHG